MGSAGAGKSTLARRLGHITGLPVVHLDAIFWRPGWVPTPDAEWDKVVVEVASKESWIIDGNYGRTMVPRLERADTVLFLDFSQVTCLWRVFKRWLRYHGEVRPDLAPGCPERLSWAFVGWVWSYPKRSRPRVVERLGRLSEDTVVVDLRSQGDVDAFLESLANHRRT